jgi:hypothetical protein
MSNEKQQVPTEQQEEVQKEQVPVQTENKKKKKRVITIICLVILIILLLLLLRRCGTQEAVETVGNVGLEYDKDATEGGWDERDEQEIIDELNRKVEEGYINISMNTNPVFANGTAQGNLMIVNDTVNNYPQVVEIIRNDTEEVIYTSGGIPVGSKIVNAALDVDLPAGTYECTAMFHNADPETGSYLGTAGAIITITVLE